VQKKKNINTEKVFLVSLDFDIFRVQLKFAFRIRLQSNRFYFGS